MVSKRLLIISLSSITSDARVLKQIGQFSAGYEVTTCGYGPTPPGVTGHIRIPDDIAPNNLDGRLITARWYGRAYRSISAVRWCRTHLRGRPYDVVLANDVETVPLALWLRAPDGVHVDLHEYAPRLHEEHEPWRRRIAPYLEWVCRRYVARASSWTTVSGGLAREYEREFGFRPEVVTNAAPYVDAEIGPVKDGIRLVHSGACLRNRHLAEMIEGVTLSRANVTLDLYLTPNDPAYLLELKEQAARSGNRIRVNDPVPYAELNATLNRFDVGVHLLPPVNFNNEWSLPNKIFDYVQARLGIIVGPSPEMVDYVRRFQLGAVTDGFTPTSLAATLDDLTAAQVTAWKQSSNEHAHVLSAESQVLIWKNAIDSMVDSQTN